MVRENIANSETQDSSEQGLYNLVIRELSPWLSNSDTSNWQLADITTDQSQQLLTIYNTENHRQFTALICCLAEPEIVAVSCSNKHHSMLNPYIDGPERVEPDMDSVGCWQILNIVFKPENGVERIRYEHNGQILDARINEYGFISIVDWNSCKPLNEYLALLKDGEWREPVISLAPYTASSIAQGLTQAHPSKASFDEWNRWLYAGFIKLGLNDYKMMETGILEALSGKARQQIRADLLALSKQFTQVKTSKYQGLFLPA